MFMPNSLALSHFVAVFTQNFLKEKKFYPGTFNQFCRISAQTFLYYFSD